MKKISYVFFISILLSNFAIAAECLTDHQICRKRSSMIYQLDKVLSEIKEACGREPSLYIDWKSFEPILAGKDTYSVDSCTAPIVFFTELCRANLEQGKKLLNTVEGFECSAAGVDKQAIDFKNGNLNFAMDPTNDWRSDRKGPSVSDFVKKEMKALFKVSVSNKKEQDDIKRTDEGDKRKQAEQARDLERKKKQDEIKATVEANNAKIKKKSEIYQAETKRLTEWLQKEIKAIQASDLKPEEKGKKMTEASEKYQTDLQKAVKAYSEGQ
tara:strand:- start:17996 stop:18805 length:810 start_codon:yes stop_codon:yes gene_type:complete